MNQSILDDYKTLIVVVMIVSIETIGIVQWLKSLVAESRHASIKAIIVLLPCAIMNTTLVPYLFSSIFNIVFLTLAVEQLAYDVIVKGVPAMISSLFERAADYSNSTHSVTTNTTTETTTTTETSVSTEENLR